jgi:UDP:flavonoid glycosyltransferase YjiC (YdhE family)
MPSRDYDVLIATDFRHSGGTTASIAEEIEVQARLGLKTGIIQIDSSYVRAPSWADRIHGLVGAGLATVVSSHEPATAHLLVLRHPRVFAHATWQLAARADSMVMVANQLPQDGASEEPYYHVATVMERLRAELGTVPPWSPIGPMVRDSLVSHGRSDLELTPFDWHNVINADLWAPKQPRTRGRNGGVIGRHSRDNAKKWPENRSDLLCAYPDSSEQRVRVLGGSRAASRVLGHRPRHWEVLPFGSLAPEDFLAGVDVYVYFHHSGWREAFGRSVLEALAAGLPVVAHPYLERLFGDTCHYCEPGQAPSVVRDLLRDSRGEINQRGIELVRERYDWEVHRRRLAPFLPRVPSSVSRPSATRRRKVLFFSSNGSGMGHLTRLLAIARCLPRDYEPLFLTSSTGLEAVRKLGFWVDYVPNRAMSGMGSMQWGEYLRARIAAALRVFRPEALIFDGTWAYDGLVAAMDEFPHVRRIWCRRAMWRPVPASRVRRSLQHLAAFDLVVEPGEFAAEADRGITASQRHLVRQVAPILLLREDELLSRDEARQALGIAPETVAGLLNLGAGNINRLDTVLATVAQAMGRHPDVKLLAAQSLISRRGLSLDPRIEPIETYPLSRVIRAFDFCIAAPGYNSFHELLASAVPTVFIPNQETEIDDQAARAAWAGERGVALVSREDDPEALSRALEQVLDPAVRDGLRERCRELAVCEGARQAADLISAQGGSALEGRSPPATGSVHRGRAETHPVSLWRRLRALDTLLRSLRARTRGRWRRLKARLSAPKRILVVAKGGLPTASEMQKLVEWTSSRPSGAVVLTSADAVPALSRRGLTVELLTDHDASDVTDQLDFASYSTQKTRVVVSAYGVGPMITWAGTEPDDRGANKPR